jgi:anti-sigma factor RsiW
MHRCRFQKKLSAYLDHQLNTKQTLEISSHLKECKVCAEALMRFEALSGKLKAWQPPQVEPGFDAVVTEKIVSWELEKGEVKMKRKTLAILVPSGVLAGILVFLFVGVSSHRSGQVGTLRGTEGQLSAAGNLASNVRGGSFEADKMMVSYGMPNAKRVAFALNRGVSDSLSSSDYLTSERALSVSCGSSFDMQGGVAQGATKGISTENYPVDSDQGAVIIIQPGLPATGQEEKVIRTGAVVLEVEDGKQTYKKVADLCQELGGFLASSNFYRDNEGRESGTVTLRIPKDKFTAALDRLSALGKVRGIDTNSKDVSQEYANLTAKLDATMVVYKKMLEALEKKQVTISDAVRLESELTPILKRVQDLKNEIESLNNLISFTTITVNFSETYASFKALKESGRFIRESILNAGINAVQLFAKAIPVMLGFAAALIVLLGIAALVKHWVVRFFKRD